MTKNVFGSDELLPELHSNRRHSRSHSAIMLYYDHRQQEGFREANSDYDLNAGQRKLV